MSSVLYAYYTYYLWTSDKPQCNMTLKVFADMGIAQVAFFTFYLHIEYIIYCTLLLLRLNSSFFFKQTGCPPKKLDIFFLKFKPMESVAVNL